MPCVQAQQHLKATTMPNTLEQAPLTLSIMEEPAVPPYGALLPGPGHLPFVRFYWYFDGMGHIDIMSSTLPSRLLGGTLTWAHCERCAGEDNATRHQHHLVDGDARVGQAVTAVAAAQGPQAELEAGLGAQFCPVLKCALPGGGLHFAA